MRETNMVMKVLCLTIILTGMARPVVGAPVNYCDHSLFPIRGGSQWVYSGTPLDPQGGYSLSVIAVAPTQTSSTAILTATFEDMGQAVPLGFACDSGGIRLVEVDNFTIPLGPLGSVTLSLTDQQGYLLPSMDVIKSKKPWEMKIRFGGTLFLAESGKTIDMSGELEIDSQWIDQEDVDVPAGFFPGSYVIRQDVTWRLGGRGLDIVPEGFLKITHTRRWYLAPSVGPVGAELRGNRSELVSYSVK
ncbi:hypothetical protein [Desulfosoma sp.]